MNEPEWKQEEMKYLESSHEGVTIQAMARGMSQEECADFFGVTIDMLKDEAEDWNFFQFHYRIGRSNGRKQAVDSLFKQMDQRGGGQVSLSYLARFADEWEADIEADKEATGKKSFRVVLD